MSDASFALLATETAATKRLPPLDANDLRGSATAYLSGLSCLPLDPVDAELAARQGLVGEQLTRLRQTAFQGGPDIKPGDILTVNSVDYQVIRTEPYLWSPDDTNWLVVVVEDDSWSFS